MKSISVIVPIYHGENYVSNIIQQMEICKKNMKQEETIEVLLVNDAPDTPLSSSWESETVRIIVINTDRNAGIHGARIKGLQACSGEYVLFLDQDDVIRPEYFCSQLEKIGENDAVVCEAIYDKKKFYSESNIFRNMISKEYIFGKSNSIVSPGQVLLRKQSIPNAWIENILKHNGADDWFLWLCMIEKGCTFSLNEEVLYEHIWHGGNASSDLAKMQESEREILHIARDKNLFSAEDLNLLIDGMFQKHICHIREYGFTYTKLRLLDKWMTLKENDQRLSAFLFESGIKTVAIYGYGFIGKHLYAELSEDMQVKYFIDKNAGKLQAEIPIYSLDNNLSEVDGIIITLFDHVEEVEKEVRKMFNRKIIILKDWIMDLEVSYLKDRRTGNGMEK